MDTTMCEDDSMLGPKVEVSYDLYSLMMNWQPFDHGTPAIQGVNSVDYALNHQVGSSHHMLALRPAQEPQTHHAPQAPRQTTLTELGGLQTLASRAARTNSGDTKKRGRQSGFHTDRSGETSMTIARRFLPSPQAVSYARPLDWERLKSTIRMLYLEDNMPVPDLIVYMSSEYNFHATINMYKKQFKKWKWAKYRSREAGKLASKTEQRTRTATCRRDLGLRRTTIDCSKTADGLLEIALRSYGAFIEDYTARRVASGAGELHDGLHRLKFAVDIETAMIHFFDNDRTTGLRFLRRGLWGLERAIHNFDIKVGIAILWDIPDSMADLEQWEYLDQYLSYLTRLSVRPVACVAAAHIKILRQCRYRAMRFLGHAIGLYGRNGTKVHSVKIEVEQHLCQLRLGVYTGDPGWAIKQLVQKFTDQIQRAHEARDHETATDLMMETARLLGTGAPSQETLEHIHRAKTAIVELACGDIDSFSEWKYYLREIYGGLQALHVEHHIRNCQTGAATEAAMCLRKLMGSGPEYATDRLLDLSRCARDNGMSELAVMLHGAWAEEESFRFNRRDNGRPYGSSSQKAATF